MMDDPFGLSPIWSATLEIYDQFAAICEEYGLRYYVTDGAALGAVRHDSFIPWDDDLDISMPREDYEKFIEISKTELPPHLKFVNWKNTPEMTLLFGKIQDCRRERVEEIEKQCGHMLSNGVYIDIFPIDGYPKSGVYAKWLKVRDAFLLLVERFHLYEYSHLSKKGKKAWLVGMCLSIFVPWLRKQHQFLALHEKSIKKYPFETSKFVGRTCQRMNVFRRVPVPKEIWGKPTPHAFNGRMVMVPEDIRAHLVNEYGPNYMTPPPEDKRKPGHSYAWRCPWWLGPTMG